ncbi:UL53 glycoprotein K [Meleagrid alphaherpesvirus 1]|uniref:Envelope glycoprotein K n=1 Tax=Meleagrid herpesvirus 1 TaxID=37108 RepID=Q9DH66_MEHV1|nr:envelope glycoprotein K [Meleagrid alphaherpesvirus 1]AKQ48621.1 envelope glycoprotein K [iBAC vector pMeHV1-C7]AKQ48693.1 envelope glycoprotein K [iBAC vector pMeHV1-C9]AKQ48765.1 envelope glycoprotein K [iBAC vector pMeHV1-C10]AKQ48837.1 envelope glycoprotein K [iBAC vector pMeHV1-C17]AKQ48910.1 envelope glycoprotein K [iBAC vector pMeHV1-C18]
MSYRPTIGVIAIIISMCMYMTVLIMHLSRLTKGGGDCIYAISTGGKLSTENFTWERYNSTLIYTPLQGKFLMDGENLDDTCRSHLVNSSAVNKLSEYVLIDTKVRFVKEARNCVAYIWKYRIRPLCFALALYVIAFNVRKWRCMFGVVRNDRDSISAIMYTKNYASRVISNLWLKTTYCKIYKLMHEINFFKKALSRAFKEDPITFTFSHKVAACLIILECMIRVCAQCVTISIISIFFVPCETILSTWVLIVTGVFVGIIICIELSLVCSPSPEVSSSFNVNVKEMAGQLNVETRWSVCTIFSNCCAAVVSGIFLKAIYFLFMITAIVIIVRYERALQIALFGRAYLP